MIFDSRLAAFVIGLLVTCSAYSQAFNKLSPRAQAVIDSTYNALLKKHKVVGASIAVVDNGEIVYATGYGFADLEKNVKASEKTIYRIGSCTKSFTSLSILQLQEKGLLSIHHSVKKYLPELTISSRFNDNNEIFINDMMCHVSGLPCDILNGFFCDAPPDMSWEILQLNKQTTISPRRYKRAYSNVAYGLLGEVVARTGKTTYNNYVRENIFTPLQMTSSFIDMDEQLAVEYSKGYYDNKLLKEPLVRDQAAGLIHSNVIDMSHYIQMYLGRGTYNGRQLLTPQSLKDMEANHLQDVLLSSKDNWGYGLYTKQVMIRSGRDSSIVNIIGHGGDTYAYHSDFAYVPELGIGVVVLTNSNNGTKIHSAHRLLKLYLKEVKSKKINFEYKAPTDSAAIKPGETACTTDEIKGQYNLNSFVLDVKNPKKIKFRQGPATIVFTRKKDDPSTYTVKAVLLKVIPIKVKNQEVSFVKIKNDVYVKSVNTKAKSVDYLGVKTNRREIPATWKNAFGNYKITGTIYGCAACPFGNRTGLTMKLMETKGFVRFKTKGKSENTSVDIYTNVVFDKIVVTGGIGRGTGETIRILDNGNIYYSGFEFEKVK